MNKKEKIIGIIIGLVISIVVFFAINGIPSRTIVIERNGALASATATVEEYGDPIDSELKRKPKRSVALLATISAYSSEPGQTDSTPFITASMIRVRPGIVANNCLQFGTKVDIGGTIYTVEDRMNRRYNCLYYDIWFEETADAWEFGRQQLEVVIL